MRKSVTLTIPLDEVAKREVQEAALRVKRKPADFARLAIEEAVREVLGPLPPHEEQPA